MKVQLAANLAANGELILAEQSAAYEARRRSPAWVLARRQRAAM